MGEAPFSFKSGERETDAVIDLPVEIRNDVARLEIVGERSAGAVQLLDKRWRRRTVGVVSGSTADRSQPLIGATYYLSRALNPFADVSLAEGVAPAEAVTRFLDRHLPMLILADVGNVTDALDRLNKWIDNGGVLVRFAGPHLARRRRQSGAGKAAARRPHPGRQPELGKTAATRRLLARKPVQRNGGADRRHCHPPGAGRTGLTTDRPHLGDACRRHAARDCRAPRQRADRAVPCDGRQPLVRSAAVGRLRRHASAPGRRSQAPARPPKATAPPPKNAGGRAAQVVPPTRVLDGFGAFTTPPPTARPIPSNFTGRGSLDHPPGFYGPPEGLVAVNTLAPADRPAPLDVSPLNARTDVYRHGEPLDLARADLSRRACAAHARRTGGGYAVGRVECACARAGAPRRRFWRSVCLAR